MSGNLAKHLFDQGVSADGLTTVRLIVAGLALWGAAWMGRFTPFDVGVVATAPPADSVLLLGAFGLSLWAMMFTFFRAVEYLGVSLGIILQFTHPALIILFTWAILRHVTRPIALVAVACVMTGVVLIVSWRHSGPTSQPIGFVWGLASAVANAVYLLLGSHVQKRFATGPALLYGFSYACLFALLWTSIQGGQTLDILVQSRGNVMGAGAIGLFGTLGAFALMVLATRYISPLEAGLASGLEAVFASLIAAWWFGERLSASQFLGAGLVLVGVSLSYLPSESKKATGRA
jgi:drug/metabolite transporter (DMT)-like permease